MKHLLAAMMILAPGVACAQSLLELRDDLAFVPGAVESFAELRYLEKVVSLERAGTLDADPALLTRIRMLMARLNAAVAVEGPAKRGIRWEVHTCRNCREEASAMAGGKLLAGEEFIASLKLDDDELAHLLAHEMAHVVAEHTREFATAARYFIDNGLRRNYADIEGELEQNMPVLLRMAAMSAQQELEADYIGSILAARAGFEPAAMLSLLAKLGPDNGPSLLATHPGNGQRLGQARNMLQIGRALQSAAIRAGKTNR